MKEINKKHGSDTVLMAGDITQTVPKFTSGSLGLDAILGGGWPGNTWSELVGEASHGKTAVAFKTIAANQRRDPEFTAVWVAAEEFVKEYAIMCGVDLSRLVLVETNIMEDAFDAVLKFAESRTVDALVLDSLPSLVPTPEEEKDMEQMTVGRGALLINKFFRKTTTTMKRSLTEQDRPLFGLVINQFRMKIGVMHGDPRTTPGGQGKDYSYFSRVEVKRDGWIEVGKGESKEKVGQSIRLRTIKNKIAPPQQTAYLDFYFKDGGECFAGEYDFGRELVSLAHHYNILDRAGAWFSFNGQKWQGADAVADAVREDMDLRDQLDKEVRMVMGR
jgi:recombination protein RecA